ncbi:Hypothetical predicted protein [Octopus vulgaris]|uniref:Uncharacterized protein n=1 Tax=Octopus vulgaris TaxID=6645 RepID=A0AA36BWH2_OCTVU|nr:Hypothetical predicted protein [Octopus vulgaris]
MKKEVVEAQKVGHDEKKKKKKLIKGLKEKQFLRSSQQEEDIVTVCQPILSNGFFRFYKNSLRDLRFLKDPHRLFQRKVFPKKKRKQPEFCLKCMTTFEFFH